MSTVLQHLAASLRDRHSRRALQVARRQADEELLASRFPSPRLAWRAQELIAEAHRIELGRLLEAAVRASDESEAQRASPVNRAAVRECRSQLLDLANRLCDLRDPVMPRGVILVERLIGEHAGALYRGDASALLREVMAARSALDGDLDRTRG